MNGFNRCFIICAVIFLLAVFISAPVVADQTPNLEDIPEYDWPEMPDIPEEDFDKAQVTNLGSMRRAIWFAKQYPLLKDHVQNALYPYAVQMTSLAQEYAIEADKFEKQRDMFMWIVVGESLLIIGGVTYLLLR